MHFTTTAEKLYIYILNDPQPVTLIVTLFLKYLQDTSSFTAVVFTMPYILFLSIVKGTAYYSPKASRLVYVFKFCVWL